MVNGGGGAVKADDGVELHWQDITMTLAPKKGANKNVDKNGDKKVPSTDAPPKRILDGVSGTARPVGPGT